MLVETRTECVSGLLYILILRHKNMRHWSKNQWLFSLLWFLFLCFYFTQIFLAFVILCTNIAA